jgi:hypothetical protein
MRAQRARDGGETICEPRESSGPLVRGGENQWSYGLDASVLTPGTALAVIKDS